MNLPTWYKVWLVGFVVVMVIWAIALIISGASWS